MAIIFCTVCGARNRRNSVNCVRCSEAFQIVQRVNSKEWEPESGLPGAIDEPTPLTTWQRIIARPVLSGSLAASVVAISLAAFWLFTYITRPPECVEYEDYGCSVILLERRLDEKILLNELNTTYQDLAYQQAEVLDWLRLLVLARQSDGSIDLAQLFDVSAGGANRLRSCSSLRDCSLLTVSEDVDYDGLSGPVGLTSQGLAQSVRLLSDSRASKNWKLEGKVNVGTLASRKDSRYFEEIHLIPLTPKDRDGLERVAARFRSELTETGVQIRVRVMFDAHSRSSSIPAARVISGPTENAVSIDRSSISVELSYQEDGIPPWIGSLATTIDHLISASRYELPTEQLSAVVFDCNNHSIAEQSYVAQSSPRVETMCFDSAKYRETIPQSAQLARVIVVSSSRESQIIAAVRALTPETLIPIFLVRA